MKHGQGDRQAAIELLGKPRRLRGYACGLQLPALLWQVRCAEVDESAIDRLDRVFASLIDKSTDTDAGPDEPATPRVGTARLLHLVHEWSCVLQRTSNIPAFGPPFLHLREKKPQYPQEGLLALPYREAVATAGAFRWAAGVANALLESDFSDDARADAATQLEPVLKMFKTFAFGGTNEINFHQAAYYLRIPVNRVAGSTYCFGLGANSRWLESSMTDAASFLGVLQATNKANCTDLFALHGLPVPRQAAVQSEEEAVQAATRLTYPVVVKPKNLRGGRGVFAGLANEDALRQAYRRSARESANIIVQEHKEGADYRFTVFNGTVIKVMRREAARVIGDGERSVRALVQELQEQPAFRNAYRRTGRQRVALDDEALELLQAQDLTPDCVPERGRRVMLRTKSNISAGGSHAMVPIDSIDPDNLHLAVRCAAILGLDLAGVDILMHDASQSWTTTGAAILEVNAQPQIGRRDTPEIYKEILSALVPRDGKVPVHLLLVDETATAGEKETHELAARLGCNAVSTASGYWTDGRVNFPHAPNGFDAALAMLLDKATRSALVVMTFTEVAELGLPSPVISSVQVAPATARTRDAAAVSRREAAERLAALQLSASQQAGDQAQSSTSER